MTGTVLRGPLAVLPAIVSGVPGQPDGGDIPRRELQKRSDL